MHILILIPTSYEIKLCPPVLSYKKYDKNIYFFSFPNKTGAWVTLTGIGQLNVNYFFENLSGDIINEIDVIISIGTCGYICGKSNVNIGDIYISNKIAYKEAIFEINVGLFKNTLFENTSFVVGPTMTTEHFYQKNQKEILHGSIDMESYHIYQFCRNNKKQFYNIRIVSDYCNLHEHADQVLIKDDMIKQYKTFLLKTIEQLKGT